MNIERARDHLHDLHNDADHVNQLALTAASALAAGRIDEAIELLRRAERPAGLIEMRLRDAMRALKAAV